MTNTITSEITNEKNNKMCVESYLVGVPEIQLWTDASCTTWRQWTLPWRPVTLEPTTQAIATRLLTKLEGACRVHYPSRIVQSSHPEVQWKWIIKTPLDQFYNFIKHVGFLEQRTSFLLHYGKSWIWNLRRQLIQCSWKHEDNCGGGGWW